jgi:predicted RNase H-like HicB family nuclease
MGIGQFGVLNCLVHNLVAETEEEAFINIREAIELYLQPESKAYSL